MKWLLGVLEVWRWRVLVLVSVRRVALERFLFRCLLRGADDLILGNESCLAHANCTLFCVPNAQKRTVSQQGKKTIFLDV